MAKPSLNPEKARQGGGGIEAGNYEVVSAKFQNVKTDYRANQLNLVFELATLDKDGDRVRGADPVEMHLPFGPKSLEAFHPGMGKNADDPEPEDQGDRVDAEGNTVYCKGDEQFSASCSALVFQKSLVVNGFPKDLLDKCWAPSYAGLKFALDTVDPKTANERYKLRLNTRPVKDETGEERSITYKVVSKWLNPTYLSGSAKDGTGKAAASDSAGPASASDIAAACIRKVAAQKAGGSLKTKASLVGFATNAFATGKFKGSNLSEVKKFFEDDTWLAETLPEYGEMEFDDDGKWTGKVTFPKAG